MDRLATGRALLDELNSPLTKLLEQLEASERVCSELSDRVQTLEREASESQQRMQSLTSDNDALTSTNGALNERVSELDDELQRSAQASKDKIARMKTAALRRIQDLRKSDTNLQQLNAQLTERAERAEDENVRLEARVHEIEARQAADVSGNSERADGFVTAVEDVEMRNGPSGETGEEVSDEAGDHES